MNTPNYSLADWDFILYKCYQRNVRNSFTCFCGDTSYYFNNRFLRNLYPIWY